MIIMGEGVGLPECIVIYTNSKKGLLLQNLLPVVSYKELSLVAQRKREKPGTTCMSVTPPLLCLSAAHLQLDSAKQKPVLTQD